MSDIRESDIQNKIRIALSPYGKFFRVNTGTGWTGVDSVRIPGDGHYFLQAGDVVIKRGRPFSTGTPVGFSDLIGAVPTVVNGQKFAQFAAIEIKTDTGRTRPEQKNFIEVMQSVGCLAGVARSPEDALKIIGGRS